MGVDMESIRTVAVCNVCFELDAEGQCEVPQTNTVTVVSGTLRGLLPAVERPEPEGQVRQQFLWLQAGNVSRWHCYRGGR